MRWQLENAPWDWAGKDLRCGEYKNGWHPSTKDQSNFFFAPNVASVRPSLGVIGIQADSSTGIGDGFIVFAFVLPNFGDKTRQEQNPIPNE